MDAPTYQLRQATRDDASFAYRVEDDAMRRYAEETWGHWALAGARNKFIASFNPTDQFVVTSEGVPIGILAFTERDEEIALEKLYLLSAHRCRGIGASLLRSVKSKSRGKPIRLRTLTVNTRAQAFYKRQGFQVERRDTERIYFVSNGI